MDLLLTGKRALITGRSKGIGERPPAQAATAEASWLADSSGLGWLQSRHHVRLIAEGRRVAQCAGFAPVAPPGAQAVQNIVQDELHLRWPITRTASVWHTFTQGVPKRVGF